MLLRERFECLADLRKRALLAIRRTATAAVVDPTQPAAIAGRNGLGLGGRRWPRTRFADVTACLADQLVATLSPHVCTVTSLRPPPAVEAAA